MTCSRKRYRSDAPRAQEGRRRLLEACDQAAEIVLRGRDRYDADEIHRPAAEAVLGRIGDAARKLTEEFEGDLPPSIPWKDIVGLRIIVDHAYHKIDYGIVWSTLEHDVPELRRGVIAWGRERDLVPAYFLERERAADAEPSGEPPSAE
jgi:uncharacterized protein with HEPN domain